MRETTVLAAHFPVYIHVFSLCVIYWSIRKANLGNSLHKQWSAKATLSCCLQFHEVAFGFWCKLTRLDFPVGNTNGPCPSVRFASQPARNTRLLTREDKLTLSGLQLPKWFWCFCWWIVSRMRSVRSPAAQWYIGRKRRYEIVMVQIAGKMKGR